MLKLAKIDLFYGPSPDSERVVRMFGDKTSVLTLFETVSVILQAKQSGSIS
jgi:hypothetical protein